MNDWSGDLTQTLILLPSAVPLVWLCLRIAYLPTDKVSWLMFSAMHLTVPEPSSNCRDTTTAGDSTTSIITISFVILLHIIIISIFIQFQQGFAFFLFFLIRFLFERFSITTTDQIWFFLFSFLSQFFLCKSLLAVEISTLSFNESFPPKKKKKKRAHFYLINLLRLTFLIDSFIISWFIIIYTDAHAHVITI